MVMLKKQFLLTWLEKSMLRYVVVFHVSMSRGFLLFKSMGPFKQEYMIETSLQQHAF